MHTNGPVNPDNALDRLRCRLLADPSLWAPLGDIADANQFTAAVMTLAGGLGLPVDEQAIQAALRPLLPGAAPVSGLRFTDPPPSKDWLPVSTFWWGRQLCLRWSWFGTRPVREPFYGDSAQRTLFRPFNRFLRFVTPIEALGPWLEAHPGLQPNGFVFHMSRCGSTLVSQMLAAPARHVAISEAPPIDDVVRARTVRPDLTEDEQARWLTWIVAALGQPRGEANRYFIKLDCWHTPWLPLFRRAFPEVPWMFLYREPVEVLESHRTMPGIQSIPGFFGQDLFGIDHLFQPDDLPGHLARFLAVICEPVVQLHASLGGLLVNYRELPAAIHTRILPHFGVDLDAEDRAAMDAASRLDAKKPHQPFTPDEAAKQKSATEAARAAAALHLSDVYRRLETARLQ